MLATHTEKHTHIYRGKTHTGYDGIKSLWLKKRLNNFGVSSWLIEEARVSVAQLRSVNPSWQK